MELKYNDLNDNLTLNRNDTIELLLDGWFVENVEGSYIFYKHVKSPDETKLFQIVLSGSDMDGIYQLEILPSKLLKGEIANGQLKLHLQDNLDVYAFERHFEGFQKENSYTIQKKGLECVLRHQFNNNDYFKQALLDTRLITEKEFEIYSSPKKETINSTKNLILILN